MGNYSVTGGIVQTAQRIVIYGPEGIGKSTFLSHFPGVCYLDTEGSTKRLDVNRLPNPTSWVMLMDEIDWVIQNRPCQTLAIDTADWAERLCTQHICSKFHKTGIEDFGYGKGYTYVGEEFGRLLNKLDEVIGAGIHVAIAAHAQIRKFEQPDELGAYDRWELKLSKQSAPLLKEWADTLLFANYKTNVITTEGGKNKAQGSRRVMYTQHAASWDAKNRYGLPEMTDFDYGVIAPFIDSTPAPAPAQPPQPSFTPPPVTQPSAPTPPPVEAPAPQVDISGQIPACIPKDLADLMRQNAVTPDMLQAAVASKGWFPPGTPFENYGQEFYASLVAQWPKVYSTIVEMGDLPF